jgi:hypothetical protein
MSYLTYEDYEEAVSVLKAVRKHVKYANITAERRHDNYGDYYMDRAQYEIMGETEELLSKIEKIIKRFNSI